MKSYTLLLSTVILLAVTACKKSDNTPASNTVDVTVADAGKTLTVTNGQILSVTLSNPGDGGYTFNTPLCDTTIIRLTKHTHIAPVDVNRVGDFGNDTFEFSPVKAGTSTLSITASRGNQAASTVAVFTGTVNVK